LERVFGWIKKGLEKTHKTEFAYILKKPSNPGILRADPDM